MTESNYFSERDVTNVIEEVIEYINGKRKKLSEDTVVRYRDDIFFFLREFIVNKMMIGDYTSWFTSNILKSYFNKRKSNTARSAIAWLLEVLEHHGRLELKFTVQVEKKLSQYLSESPEELDFLNVSDIKYIFSRSIDYNRNDKELPVVAPVVWFLSFFCMLEPTHIVKLKISDINQSSKLVRNIRADQDDTLLKWIKITDDKAFEIIQGYMEYRKALSVKTDALIVYNGKPVKGLNKFFLFLRDRSKNSDKLSTNVNGQKLVRTGVLFSLIKSKGKDAFELIRIHGLKKNTQLDNALLEYMITSNNQETYF